MIYGMSNFKIRKLPEKMISINFLSINADYVSIFIEREREREREKAGISSPGGVQFM